MVKKCQGKKSFCQQDLGSEIFFGKNVFWSKKLLDQKNFWIKKILDQKNFYVKKIFGQKILGQQIFLGWKKLLGQKDFWVKKIFGSKKFLGQNMFYL